MPSGSPETSTRTVPQKHSPACVAIFLSNHFVSQWALGVRPYAAHFLRIENETQDGNGILRAQVAHPNVRNHADIRSRFANCRDAELHGDTLMCYWHKSVPVLRNEPIDNGKFGPTFHSNVPRESAI
jgi:hypothetical protein